MEYEQLRERLDGADETFWLGPSSDIEVGHLEKLLEVPLPPSFKEFLSKIGGGGVIGSEISGIHVTADHDDKGTVWGDTKQCRRRFGLPNHLIVVLFTNDEVCWALDSSRPGEGGEYPVVSYDVFRRKVDRILSPTFREWFREYVELRAADII